MNACNVWTCGMAVAMMNAVQWSSALHSPKDVRARTKGPESDDEDAPDDPTAEALHHWSSEDVLDDAAVEISMSA